MVQRTHANCIAESTVRHIEKARRSFGYDDLTIDEFLTLACKILVAETASVSRAEKLHQRDGDLKGERWKPIKGHEGIYDVSSYGRIRRWVGTGIDRRSKRRDLRPDDDGYVWVQLWKAGKPTHRSVNVLVAEQFLKKRPSARHTVDHINGNAWDNRVDNLRWATPEQQKAGHGLGENNPGAKFTMADAREIRKRYRGGESITSLAKEWGTTKLTIQNLVRVRTYKS